MIFLYRALLYLMLPAVLCRLLIRAASNRSYLHNIPQRFGFGIRQALGKDFKPDGIWIHAVSVGEVNAAAPLVNHFLARYPEKSITITTMTPTGSERVRLNFGYSVNHCYLPYDYPGAVRRFLNAVRPQIAMVMETEIWPNLIHECSVRQIPMIYTNVRLSARSHKGYARFKKFVSQILGEVYCFVAQSRGDADRLIDLGVNAERVEITGSIKFEMDMPASIFEAAQSVRRDLGWERPVWVAGSTHEGEESQIIDAFLKAKKEVPNLLLVLVPRHPERFSTVYRLCNRYQCNTVQRSQTQGEIPADTEIYLVDTMGDLKLLIAACDFTFIGGSLVPTGGHNLLEACAAGVAVVFGPHMFNFQEISERVLSRGAGVQVMDSEELCEVVKKLSTDPVLRDQHGTAGKEFVESNKGALKKICKIVDKCFESLAD